MCDSSADFVQAKSTLNLCMSCISLRCNIILTPDPTILQGFTAVLGPILSSNMDLRIAFIAGSETSPVTATCARYDAVLIAPAEVLLRQIVMVVAPSGSCILRPIPQYCYLYANSPRWRALRLIGKPCLHDLTCGAPLLTDCPASLERRLLTTQLGNSANDSVQSAFSPLYR